MSISRVRWLVTGDEHQDAVLEYAATELARYTKRLTGSSRPPTRPAVAMRRRSGTAWLGLCDKVLLPPGVELRPSTWDDGYALWSADGSLYIVGTNARSVLFGVYAYLESQGVRFLRPGPDGEVLPNRKALTLPEEPTVSVAHYRHRGVCIEGAPSLEIALDMVDWCAKKRLNTIFLQFFSSQYFYNNWYERWYNPGRGKGPLTEEEALAMDSQVISALKQRGLIFHRVGHSWTSAAFDMPRSGWVTEDDGAVKPEYRRFLALVGGERKLFGNVPINTELCYSYKPAFDRFVENVVRYCEEHPELDVVHVWLSDAANNKCECPECRELSISDWYAKVINALSEQLAERVPGKRFVFLCYIELLWPPERVQIDESHGNAIMMFAPISRCYGHALHDPSCDDGLEWPRPALNQFQAPRYNAFFVRQLRAWREAFHGDSFDFDYHLMWAIWQQLTDTHLARIFHEDLQKLRELGLNGIISCQSFRAFYPSGLAMTVLAESLWDPTRPFAELRDSYYEAAYGRSARFAGSYLAGVESYLDSGDPHWRTCPFAAADEAKLRRFLAFLRWAGAELAAQRQTAADPARRRSLDILRHHIQLLRLLARAHLLARRGDAQRAAQNVERARELLRQSEARMAHVLDTMLALKHCVEAHKPA